MAHIAGVGNLESVGHCRSGEMKVVAPHVHVGDGLLDLRHVASNALTAFASDFVMRMLLDGRCARAVRRIRAVAIEA